MNNLDLLIQMLKNNLEVDLLPVAIGALQVYQKNPSVEGAAAAEAYALGNAPAALLTAKVSLLQTAINDLSAELAKLQAVKPAA